MKTIKIYIVLIFILLINKYIIAQDFFDVSNVSKLEIFFEETKWDSLLDQYWSDAEDERLIGVIKINGDQFDSVGVRYKGYSSYRISSDKKPLNIKLDFLQNQGYQGVTTLKLSNVYRDPSFLREVLGYEIARKYMPASKANYINVYINDEHFGLYSSIETIDKSFIENHFFEDDGVFIKGAPQRSKGGYVLMGEANLKYLGTDTAKYLLPYDLKSDYGWTDLIELCDILNNDVNQLHTVFNIDRALWFLAFHNVLVSLDSPINAPRNFYLYKDLNGKFNILPWDLNMTFATYGLLDGTWNHTLEDYQNLNPFFNLDSDKYPLISKMLLNSFYKRQYIAHMKTILDENFSNNWYRERAIEIHSVIEQFVQSDPQKTFTYDNFINNLEVTVENDVHTIYGITELMEGRIDYFNNHDMFLAAKPKITNISYSPLVVKKNSTLIISAKLENEDLVQLGYRNSILDEFQRLDMIDDGTNGDVNANDGVYSITIPVGSSNIQYYIYSDNYQAAEFSPQRAEYEYHTITVEPDLVINEFMASNDTRIPDQDGEFDDWIELYNNSTQSIPLSGYYLSDNASKLKKWSFPNVTIGGNQYLIIWADEDSSQNGLHANFKLSSSGERIFLVNSSEEIIDEIVFGSQITDTSFGRFPNGTGEFGLMESSFGIQNNLLITSIFEDDKTIPNKLTLEQNYPNPFNPITNIRYSIPSLAVNSNELSDVKKSKDFLPQIPRNQNNHVQVIVYDVLGRKVATLVNENQKPDNYEVEWNATNNPSGLYFYQLKVGQFSQTNKMILLK